MYCEKHDAYHCKLPTKKVYDAGGIELDCPLQDAPDGDGWISVDDRLPKMDIDVIIYNAMEYCEIDIACRIKSNANTNEWEWINLNNEDFTYSNVTHWRTLPKPPKQALLPEKEGK